MFVLRAGCMWYIEENQYRINTLDTRKYVDVEPSKWIPRHGGIYFLNYVNLCNVKQF